MSYISSRSSKGDQSLSQSEGATTARNVAKTFVHPISSEAPPNIPFIIVDDTGSSESYRPSFSDYGSPRPSSFGSGSSSASLELNNECEAIKKAEESLQVLEEMKRIFEERENSHRQAINQLEKNFEEQIAPLISQEVLDKRLEMMENLVVHVRTILENGSSLVDKLKQRITTDVMPIKYEEHRSVVEYCDLAVDMISEFRKYMETIRWFGDKNLEKNINMESYVGALSRIVVGMELNMKALLQFRDTLGQLRIVGQVQESCTSDCIMTP